MLRRTILIPILTLLSACSQFTPEFTTVVNDHQLLTTETNTALIKSINTELTTVSDPDAQQALNDLKERLMIISAQSKVIDQYVKNNITTEQLQEFLKSKGVKK